jgi:hypothetical protein
LLMMEEDLLVVFDEISEDEDWKVTMKVAKN